MTPDQVVEIMHRMLYLAALIVTPLLGSGLVVGLIVAVVQAATQIQESSLSFLPKLVTLGAVLALGGPWILGNLVGFATESILQIADLSPGRIP